MNWPWVTCGRTSDRWECVCTGCGAEAVTSDGAHQSFLEGHAGCGGATGLGDVVAAVAKPVARAVGLPADCVPCARRRAKLNRAVPLSKK